MLAVQADVVGGREGLLGEAGDAIHRVVPAEVQPEVIPLFCLPGYNLHALERKAPGKAEAVQGTPELAHAEAQRGLPSPLLNTFWENPESPPSTLGHWPRCCGSDTDFPWGLVWLLLSPLCSTSQVPPQTPGDPGCAGSMAPDPQGPGTSWSSSWSQEGCPGAFQTTLESSVWVTQLNSVQPAL